MFAGQLWSVNTLGGFMYADNLSAKLRMAVQPMVKFRQFCDIKDAAHQGLHKGQTFHWDVYSDVSAQGTTLTETNTMPETNFTITQGTMTITEFGQAVPYTGKLEALAEHKVTEIINKVLKNDALKAFDNAAAAEFNKTALRYSMTQDTGTYALTTDGTPTQTNSAPLGTAAVAHISTLMQERNIPAYTGSDYYAIALPTVFLPLQIALEGIQQYTPQGFGMIMNSEIGRYHNVRFVTQTHIGHSGMGYVAGDWTNGLSNWALFFGEDTVAEAIAIPEEVRAKIPTDFGRSQAIAWYYLGGFGLTHDSTNGYSPVANERIVMWDSAA